MSKGFQLTLALLGPLLDLAGAFLLSVYVVAGSERTEATLQHLKEFSYSILICASRLLYRDARAVETFLNAPISRSPGVAAVHWLLYPLAISAVALGLLLVIPSRTAIWIAAVPLLPLIAAAYIVSLPLGFQFLVRWAVEREKERRVSVLGLLLLASGFVVQGLYNVTSLL